MTRSVSPPVSSWCPFASGSQNFAGVAAGKERALLSKSDLRPEKTLLRPGIALAQKWNERLIVGNWGLLLIMRCIFKVLLKVSQIESLKFRWSFLGRIRFALARILCRSPMMWISKARVKDLYSIEVVF
jgi:hypothetical protein